MPRQAINPPELFDSLQYGFSQITVGTGSRIITISGQVGWNEHEQITAKDDLLSQTMKAFRNLETAIKAAGSELDDILSLRIYIVDTVIEQSAPIREALTSFFPTSPPTTTWIGVPRLANKDFLVEVEALAVLA